MQTPHRQDWVFAGWNPTAEPSLLWALEQCSGRDVDSGVRRVQGLTFDPQSAVMWRQTEEFSFSFQLKINAVKLKSGLTSG